MAEPSGRLRANPVLMAPIGGAAGGGGGGGGTNGAGGSSVM